eukprot:scaffold33338_cov48-Phaeocystis_antarctica.AAC.1
MVAPTAQKQEGSVPNRPSGTVSISEPTPPESPRGKLPPVRPPMYRQATAAALMGHTRVAPDGAAAYGGDKYPIRAAIYKILERPRSSRTAMALFAVTVVAIVASTITWALSTVEGMEDNKGIMGVEIICNVVFTFELTLRLYAMQAELMNLIKDPTFYVDVLSLLPFYIQCGVWISNADSVPEEAKLLRLLGVLRVLKLLRHYSGWRVLIIAVKRSSRPIFVPMFAILVATLIFGGILQKLESETFPDVFDSMYDRRSQPEPEPQLHL